MSDFPPNSQKLYEYSNFPGVENYFQSDRYFYPNHIVCVDHISDKTLKRFCMRLKIYLLTLFSFTVSYFDQ